MIIRSPKNKNFTVISNHYIENPVLSWKAKGILTYLLTKPDTWNLYIKNIVNSGRDGNTSVRSAVAELEQAGYIQKDVIRAEDGRITGTDYLIFESSTRQKEAASQDRPTVTPEAQPDPQEPRVCSHENRIRKTQIRETTPIVNTDNNQILTENDCCVKPEVKPKTETQKPSSSYPAVGDVKNICGLIPDRFRQPMVIKLVNNALNQHPESEVEEAIAYASANVRGGHMQYKAYLDKTLKNRWAEGYLDAMAAVPDQKGLSPAWITGGKYPNGTVTGSKRMDSNIAAAADFLREMKGGS